MVYVHGYFACTRIGVETVLAMSHYQQLTHFAPPAAPAGTPIRVFQILKHSLRSVSRSFPSTRSSPSTRICFSSLKRSLPHIDIYSVSSGVENRNNTEVNRNLIEEYNRIAAHKWCIADYRLVEWGRITKDILLYLKRSK